MINWILKALRPKDPNFTYTCISFKPDFEINPQKAIALEFDRFLAFRLGIDSHAYVGDKYAFVVKEVNDEKVTLSFERIE